MHKGRETKVTDPFLSRGGNLLSGALAGTEQSSPKFQLSPVFQSSVKKFTKYQTLKNVSPRCLINIVGFS